MLGCGDAVRAAALGDGMGTPGRPVQYSTPVFGGPVRVTAGGSEEAAATGAGAGGGGAGEGGGATTGTSGCNISVASESGAGDAAATASSVARSSNLRSLAAIGAAGSISGAETTGSMLGRLCTLTRSLGTEGAAGSG
jgi:hypothetical protein